MALLSVTIGLNTIALGALALRSPTRENVMLAVLTAWLDLGAVLVLRGLRGRAAVVVLRARLGPRPDGCCSS